MATQVFSKSLGTSVDVGDSGLDQSKWTELQHLQYTIGIWDGIENHSVRPHELPEWKWKPNEEWRKARGMLNDHPEHDTTAARKADREWERAHDERKFGSSSR